jgi:hypothetical protein
VKSSFVAALSLLCLSLGAAAATETVYPPGSRIGLAPPKDMKMSKRFTGFENLDKAASITLLEMPAEAYDPLTANLTDTALKNQGLSVTSREQLKIGGRQAVLIAGDQAGAGKLRKWMLAMADSTMTGLVVAQSLATKEGYSETQMRDALKSVALRAPLPIEDQMAALSFRLGNQAGFRPVRVLSGNSLLLTDGPQDVIRELEQPILVVASSLSPAPPSGEVREQFARAALLSNQTLKNVAVERSQAFRLKGQEWHEIVARATDSASGRPIVVMQTIRFAPDKYVRMVGISRAEARDDTLPRFRAVIDNVEFE